jgi:hypothetical protein
MEIRTKNAEDAENKRGELIEPAKPIVYYIDPSTQINGKIY